MKNHVALAVSLVVLVAPAQAMAAKFKLDLAAQEDQVSRMDSGVEAVDSNMPSTSVRIFENEEKVNKRGVLMVYALNAGEKPVNLGSESVSIETADGKPIAVIPHERLLKEEKNRQMWAAIATGLGAAANSINASNAGYSHGSVSAYGSGGWARANYSSYNAGNAYAAQSLANLQNQQNFDRLQATRTAGMEALKVNLRTTTVDPGNDFGGQVTYELPKELRGSKADIPVRIRVKLGADEHVIHGKLTRQ